MLNKLDYIKNDRYVFILFVRVNMKSPRLMNVFDSDSLFMAIFVPMLQGKKHLRKELFLLVRFLWASKENEQDKLV